MSEELLPCPFCGGEAHISASSDGYGVECWNRRCIDIQLEQIPTEAEAIEAWNTRAERTCRNTWDIELTGRLRFKCSECGAVSLDVTPRYCPACGARVVEEVDADGQG